ncbi:hypothetical protein VAPA_2c04130 [Variovorax paradoxus B4]|uniref:Uncharacterized protein n=1 Tax=Variovorax paradoxus B4 TaxID=1246301 RepID=T1XK65_VARPD|nr:DUF6506 family protein [Variovorax paradoxus]AGU52973.1 hypothetical protein VAPA_2c04130 [Variovorax paradoxus B4]
MSLKAAFIFLAAGAKPDEHRCVVRTPQVDLVVVGVADYAQAEAAARSLLDEGIGAIELCGGFGNAGTARVCRAVEGRVPVGVVRFDIHPGLDGRSGDQVFASGA